MSQTITPTRGSSASVTATLKEECAFAIWRAKDGDVASTPRAYHGRKGMNAATPTTFTRS